VCLSVGVPECGVRVYACVHMRMWCACGVHVRACMWCACVRARDVRASACGVCMRVCWVSNERPLHASKPSTLSTKPCEL